MHVDGESLAHSSLLKVGTCQLDDGCCLIVLGGQADMSTAARLESSLQRAVDDGANDIVVDLTDVSFVDSTFIRVIIQAGQRIEARDGRLSLACPNRAVGRALEITGIDQHLQIHASLEAAMAVAAPDRAARKASMSILPGHAAGARAR